MNNKNELLSLKTSVIFLIFTVFWNVGFWFLLGFLYHLIPIEAWYDFPVLLCCIFLWVINAFIMIASIVLFKFHIED